MFFCDCLSIPRDFLAVFYLNSSFSFSWLTFLDNISLSSFKIWIFSYHNIISFFTFISEFSIGLRTIFYNFILWFNSFFFYFKLTCFLVEGCCVFNKTLKTFFNCLLFAFFKFWIISVLCIVSKFSFFYNWFYTNSYYPIFFFYDSHSSFCWLTYRFRVFNLLSDSNFFLTSFPFVFNLLTSRL